MFEALKRARSTSGRIAAGNHSCSFCQMHYQPLYESEGAASAGARICQHCARSASLAFERHARQGDARRAGWRFSLRTLLVLITLVAVWLGWNANVVLQRKAMRRWIERIGGRAAVDGQSAHFSGETYSPFFWRHIDERRWRITPWRRLMGDEPIDAIVLPPGLAAREIHKVQQVFPEVRMINLFASHPPKPAELPGD